MQLTPQIDEEELKQLVHQAEMRGRELGLQEAAQIDQQERQKLADRMTGAISALNKTLDFAEKTAVRNSVQLALQIAEKLTRITLHNNHDALLALLSDAISKLDGDEDIRLTIHPVTAEALRNQLSSVLSELGLSSINIEENANLDPGDFLIYRGSMSVDVRLNTRLSMVEHALLQALGFETTSGEEA